MTLTKEKPVKAVPEYCRDGQRFCSWCWRGKCLLPKACPWGKYETNNTL